MNLYQAVLEYERIKNQPELTEQEIAKKARAIFDYDKLTSALMETVKKEVSKKVEKAY